MRKRVSNLNSPVQRLTLFELVTAASLFGHQGSIPTSPPPRLAPARCANCQGVDHPLRRHEDVDIVERKLFIKHQYVRTENAPQAPQFLPEGPGECSTRMVESLLHVYTILSPANNNAKFLLSSQVSLIYIKQISKIRGFPPRFCYTMLP